jgi:hypothetical protein
MGVEAGIPHQSYLLLPSLENGNKSNNLSKSVPKGRSSNKYGSKTFLPVKKIL